MIIRVKLFAQARELVGVDELEVQLPEGATVAELRAALLEAAPVLESLLGSSFIAVEQQYASDETVLQANAEVALIPPVSGG